MKKRIKKYQLIVRCTVDSVEDTLSLEKKCPFRKSQTDSRYASSWGSQYEIVYSCSLKKDLTPIKSWWSKQDSLSDLEMLCEATKAFA